MKFGKWLQIVTVSAIALGLSSSGHAQVSLLNWTWGEVYIPPYVQVIALPNYSVSADSADFHAGSGFATNGSFFLPLQPPSLYASYATTPGATYELSFSILDGSGSFGGSFSFSFGNFTTNLSLYAPVNSITRNIDFTLVATSATTAMSAAALFNDYYIPSAQFFNLSVTAVPEISSARLIGFGACVWLFARAWRRLSSRRTRT